MAIETYSEHFLGDMVARFQLARDHPAPVGLLLYPRDRQPDLCIPREFLDSAAVTQLPAQMLPMSAWEIDPLVHVAEAGHPAAGGFSQGRTLRNSPTTVSLRLIEQSVKKQDDTTTVFTLMADERGLIVEHELVHRSGERSLRVQTRLTNRGDVPRNLSLVTSFSLGGITPFTIGDAPGRLWVHRFRSAWSAEGRLDSNSVESLGLERSWTGHSVQVERFGQVGSMPVNGYFPFCAVEDRSAAVTWAAAIGQPGSWQMEVYRRADQLAFSGGLADRDFGHWSKILLPGKSFSAPEAWLTVANGNIDEACRRLTVSYEARRKLVSPEQTAELSIIFNEWCTSWGNPTHQNIIALADRLAGSGVTYLVIDDGWAERPSAGFQQNGDWIVNRLAFPHGLKATADAVRARGLIPGIWFEFEVINPGSLAWSETAHQLHRDGVPLQVGNRRFWDFRDPWVHEYLGQRVITLLRDSGFGYLKLDYNDSIGAGCDGAESLGEALREHLEGVQRFLRTLTREIPGLVIENCSSGGHRLEPSFMQLTALSSSTDAHETPDIPVIAANLHRLIPATQSQIWAVLRQSDSLQRLAYSLAATFLGRMCLSGDIASLPSRSWDFARQAMRLYQLLSPLIKDGRWTRLLSAEGSYQHLVGAQVVMCSAVSANQAILVWHAFAQTERELFIPLNPVITWTVAEQFSDRIEPFVIENGRGLRLDDVREWSGGVMVLEGAPT